MAAIRSHCGGAGCGRCLACLCRRSALAPLGPGQLSETRLAELAKLAQCRDATTPGPGAYCPALPPSREGGHHRPMTAADGPRPLAGGECSTRAREIGAAGGGGGGPAPGEYEGLSKKDALMRRARSAVVSGRWPPASPALTPILSPPAPISSLVWSC